MFVCLFNRVLLFKGLQYWLSYSETLSHCPSLTLSLTSYRCLPRWHPRLKAVYWQKDIEILSCLPGAVLIGKANSHRIEHVLYILFVFVSSFFSLLPGSFLLLWSQAQFSFYPSYPSLARFHSLSLLLLTITIRPCRRDGLFACLHILNWQSGPALVLSLAPNCVCLQNAHPATPCHTHTPHVGECVYVIVEELLSFC